MPNGIDPMNVLQRSQERQSQLRQTLLGILGQQASQRRQQAFTQQQQQAQRQFQTQQLQQRETLRRESPLEKARLAESTARLKAITTGEQDITNFRTMIDQQLADTPETPDNFDIRRQLQRISVAPSNTIPTLLSGLNQSVYQRAQRSAQGLQSIGFTPSEFSKITSEFDDAVIDYIDDVAIDVTGEVNAELQAKLKAIYTDLKGGGVDVLNREKEFVQENLSKVQNLISMMNSQANRFENINRQFGGRQPSGAFPELGGISQQLGDVFVNKENLFELAKQYGQNFTEQENEQLKQLIEQDIITSPDQLVQTVVESLQQKQPLKLEEPSFGIRPEIPGLIR